nr:hypothetical protein [Leptospira perolatii]
MLHQSAQEYNPGFLEKWGIGVLKNYVKRAPLEKDPSGPGSKFFSQSGKIIWWSFFWGLNIGFWTTFGITIVEKIFPESPELWSFQFYEKWAWTGGALIVGTLLEFYLLYELGLWAAFRITQLAGMHLEDDPDLFTAKSNLLARMALEIPDPDLKLLGIDPLKLTDKRSLLVRTVLYKAKVLLSNLVAKIVLRKVLARNSLRVYAEFIAAPITAIWDAVVLWLILSELRIRLISRVIAEDIVAQIFANERRLTKEAKLAFLAAVGNSVVFTQRFHPNLEYLLIKMYKNFGIRTEDFVFDDLETFAKLIAGLKKEDREACLKLLCLACSFDGKLSSFEAKYLKKILGQDAEQHLELIRELSSYIRTGNLEACRERSRLFS